MILCEGGGRIDSSGEKKNIKCDRVLFCVWEEEREVKKRSFLSIAGSLWEFFFGLHLDEASALEISVEKLQMVKFTG